MTLEEGRGTAGRFLADAGILVAWFGVALVLASALSVVLVDILRESGGPLAAWSREIGPSKVIRRVFALVTWFARLN